MELPTHVTFRAETTAAIRKYLEAGATQIRVHPDPDGRKWRISALDAQGQEMGQENDSWPCPPFCG